MAQKKKTTSSAKSKPKDAKKPRTPKSVPSVRVPKPKATVKHAPSVKGGAKAKPTAKKPVVKTRSVVNKPAAKKSIAKAKPVVKKSAAKPKAAPKAITKKVATRAKPAARKPRVKKVVAKVGSVVSKNPKDYPVTPVVAAYREMLRGAIDRRKAEADDKPSKTQKLYIESLEQNWKDAPYVLRNSSSTKHEPKHPHLQVAKKPVKKRKTTIKKK